MNRKVLSLLIVVVMLLAVVPAASYWGSVSASSTPQPTVSVERVPYQEASSREVDPETKISSLILDAISGKDTSVIRVVNGEKVIPAQIVASQNIGIPRELRLLGFAKIGDSVVYNVMIPATPSIKKTLLKLAQNPSVKEISTRKLELNAPGEWVSLEELTKAREEELKQRNITLYKRLEIFKERTSARVKQIERSGLVLRLNPAQFKVYMPGFSEKLKMLEPMSLAVATHHMAKNAWETYGITGKGVKISIVDTGVDFGTPALSDAYAVDMNPNSPYYGWPIMFDPGSMDQYFQFGVTFPDNIDFFGDIIPMNFYSNTSQIVGTYAIMEVPYIIGWYNATTGQSVVFSGMSLANIPDDDERYSALQGIFQWVINNIGIEEPRILVVDDDAGVRNGGDYFDVQDYYFKALDRMGIPYDRITIPADQPGPGIDVLSNYDIVLWFTGEDYWPMTSDDLSNLQHYLDNGGSLILFSDDLIYQLGEDSFVTQYLHVNVTAMNDYELEDIGIPTVLSFGSFNVSVRRVNKGALPEYLEYGDLIPSETDLWADALVPASDAQVLGVGYMAVPVFDSVPQMWIRLPMDRNLNVPLKGGEVHLGSHPDVYLHILNTGKYILPNVLVADTSEAGKYDRVYVALTTDEGMFIDFNDDPGHGKNNPVVAWDLDGDALADISGGLIYYIADGKTPIPYSDVYYERWHLAEMGIPFKVPEAGSLVAFMADPFGIHGTYCAASAAGRGGRSYSTTFWNGETYPVYGTSQESTVMAVPLLLTGILDSEWVDAMYFSAEGYDGKPGTGDEAQVVSNSYGISYTIAKGLNWDERFLYYLTTEYAPTTVFLFAAGNGGPGYGTVTEPGASPGVITVGAATDWSYASGLENTTYGDVIGWSDRGPNGLGKPDVDVLGTGAYGAEAGYLNSFLNGSKAVDVFGGTSMATPVSAGITALVYEAFYKAHGRWPTSQEVKEILMSTAENVKHDVFSQGAGYLNATRAVALALGKNGLWVSPTLWQPGKTDYPAFPNVMYPGESATRTFTIKAFGGSKSVQIEPMVFKKIGEKDIPVEVVGRFQLISIKELIPEDAELVKATMYTNLTYSMPEDAELVKATMYTNLTYSMPLEPFLRMDLFENGEDVTILNADIKEGNVVSFMVRDPLKRAGDRNITLIYADFAGSSYNATIKLEFYKRAPWDWVKVSPSALTVGRSATFKATITVPEDAPYGIYEGAIYVKYFNHETTIPVSVVVVSPNASFKFGGEQRNATGLYDNSYVYGVYDWGWRYETGDWRFFYFNSEEEHGNILVDLMWPNPGSDINLHVLGPKVDEWSESDIGTFGPYSLVEMARGVEGYVGDGCFDYATTTGGPEEVVSFPAGQGLHAIVLHNVLLNASVFPLNFTGEVGVAKAEPYEWRQVINTTSGEKNFTLNIPEFAGDISGMYLAKMVPEMYLGIVAPESGASDIYPIEVSENTTLLMIHTDSPYSEYTLDVDIYLYYWNETSEQWEQIASSVAFGSDERIMIPEPAPGEYFVRVESYLNTEPGMATYNLFINRYVQSNVLQIKSVAPVDGGYNLTLGYQFNEIPETPFRGFVAIFTQKFGWILTIPVTLIPENSKTDIAVTSVAVKKSPELGGYINITAIVENLGLVGDKVLVSVVRDGVVIPALTKTVEIGAGNATKFVYLIPVTDTYLHEYKISVMSAKDYNTEDNSKVVYAQAIPEKFADIISSKRAYFGYSIDEAKITKISSTSSKSGGDVTVNFEGAHDAVMVFYVAIPAKASDYKVTAKEASVLKSRVVLKNKDIKVIEVMVKLHSTGYVKVKYSLPVSTERNVNIVALNYLYYRYYHMYLEQFEELYNKSLELNVSNETLEEALKLHNEAAEYYQTVLELANGNVLANLQDIRLLVPLRKAYLAEMRAVKLLREALEELEAEG